MSAVREGPDVEPSGWFERLYKSKVYGRGLPDTGIWRKMSKLLLSMP